MGIKQKELGFILKYGHRLLLCFIMLQSVLFKHNGYETIHQLHWIELLLLTLLIYSNMSTQCAHVFFWCFTCAPDS